MFLLKKVNLGKDLKMVIKLDVFSFYARGKAMVTLL